MATDNKNTHNYNLECHLLDTRAFDSFINEKSKFINQYAEITKSYDAARKALLDNWKGRGADAFAKDSDLVRKNIGEIGTMLSSMCNIIEDCKKVFLEADSKLGKN